MFKIKIILLHILLGFGIVLTQAEELNCSPGQSMQDCCKYHLDSVSIAQKGNGFCADAEKHTQNINFTLDGTVEELEAEWANRESWQKTPCFKILFEKLEKIPDATTCLKLQIFSWCIIKSAEPETCEKAPEPFKNWCKNHQGIAEKCLDSF